MNAKAGFDGLVGSKFDVSSYIEHALELLEVVGVGANPDLLIFRHRVEGIFHQGCERARMNDETVIEYLLAKASNERADIRCDRLHRCPMQMCQFRDSLFEMR